MWGVPEQKVGVKSKLKGLRIGCAPPQRRSRRQALLQKILKGKVWKIMFDMNLENFLDHLHTQWTERLILHESCSTEVNKKIKLHSNSALLIDL